MLRSLLVILLCQLAGELLQRTTGVPVPAPVIGMGLMFGALVHRGGVPADLDSTASSLLRCLSLLFVPAGVGVMARADLLAAEWLPVSAALLGSSIIAIAIPALTMEWLERRRAREDGVLTCSPSIGARR